MTATRDQILGMFVGKAVADQLFAPVETFSLKKIAEKYGYIRNYILPPYEHRWFKDVTSPRWTDDTQLTLLIADSLIQHKQLNMDDLAKRHVKYWKREGDLGFGSTTRSAINKLAQGEHWWNSGKNNNPKHGFGNGLPMKVGPIGALRASPFWDRQWVEYRSAFIRNLMNLTLMTHYRRMAIDSALSHVFAVSLCLSGNFSRENFFYAIDKWSNFVLWNEIPPHQERLSDRFEDLRKLDFESLTAKNIIDLFGGGTSYVYNSLPFSYAFFLRNPDSIETLYEVGNAGGDTDTNAAIVGELLGAKNGISIFPQHLIDGLWQKDRILATAERFYETFYEETLEQNKEGGKR